LLDILLGLYNDEERKIIDGKSEFSGGERQKIALVRLFIKTADVLLLDEPTSALDVMSKERVMDYLQDIKHRLTRAHREKQLKMSCQALHNAPPNRT